MIGGEKQERKVLHKWGFRFKQQFVYFLTYQRFISILGRVFSQVITVSDYTHVDTFELFDQLILIDFKAMCLAILIDQVNRLGVCCYPRSRLICLRIVG